MERAVVLQGEGNGVFILPVLLRRLILLATSSSRSGSRLVVGL